VRKSTLLSIIGCWTHDRRAVLLNEKTVENLDFAERSRIRNQEIGFIFQSFNLIGDLTVYENVELPLTYRQKKCPRLTGRSVSWKRWNEWAWLTACGTILRSYRRSTAALAVARSSGWKTFRFFWPMSLQEIWIRATAKL